MGRRSKNIVLIHYQPLEVFPPVLNCIDYLSKNAGSEYALHVFTTVAESIEKVYVNKNVNIIRHKHLIKKPGGIATILRFLLFTMHALFRLIKLKPTAVFYYESHSALPVFLYKKYFNKKARIFIHYHEYMSTEDYSQKGMRVINFAHSKEKYLYTVAEWISHTNSERLNLFIRDNPGINKDICHVAPNFPSREWVGISGHQRSSKPVYKMVYVGSFGSFEDLYIKEVLSWVKHHAGLVTLDIYSFNIPSSISNFIVELQAENIQLKGAISYDSLPLVLQEYNIGLILYKATTLNFKYNAPNKLFEYLACGLDVWFPEEMIGCHEYVHTASYPKVIKVNFRELANFDIQVAANRDGLSERKTGFYCEDVLKPLASKLFSDLNI